MKNIVSLVNLLYKLILVSISLAIAVWPLLTSLSVVTNMVIIPSLLLGVFAVATYLEHKITKWRAAEEQPVVSKPVRKSKRCFFLSCPVFD